MTREMPPCCTHAPEVQCDCFCHDHDACHARIQYLEASLADLQFQKVFEQGFVDKTDVDVVLHDCRNRIEELERETETLRNDIAELNEEVERSHVREALLRRRIEHLEHPQTITRANTESPF